MCIYVTEVVMAFEVCSIFHYSLWYGKAFSILSQKLVSRFLLKIHNVEVCSQYSVCALALNKKYIVCCMRYGGRPV